MNARGDDLEKLRAAAATVRSGLGDKLGHMWWTFLLKGLLAIGVGLYALFRPGTSLQLLAIGLGVFCLADGVAGFIGSLLSAERRQYLLQSLASIVLGVVLFFFTGESLRMLSLLFGLWLAITGVSHILGARELPAEDGNRPLVMNLGIAALVAGLVLLFLPGLSATTLGWLIALIALVIGGLLIFLATRLRRLGEKLGP